MGNTTLVYNGIKFDSDEEVFFSMWLDELDKAGYVGGWQKSISPIVLTLGLKLPYIKHTQLKTKVKKEKKHKVLLNPSEYTPDFRVFFTDKGFDLLCSYIDRELLKPDALFFAYDKRGLGTCLSKELTMFTFEIKPSFDQNNMERLFRNNQKFTWDKAQIFVNLVEPIELFKKTFLPLAAGPYFKYKKAPTGKNKGKKKVGDWKFDFTPKTLKQFLNA